MRWSKIKNIIILLLVMVNGFLLAQVGFREWRSRRDERETRARMVDILARNDVAFLPQEVPGALALASRRVTLSPFGETEAAALVGTVTGAQDQGAGVLYTGSDGTVAITSGGELTVEFASGGAPAESELLERLSKLGIQLGRRDLTSSESETTVRYVQLWGGSPVPGETALLSLDQGGDVLALTLRPLAGSEEALPAEETITAATALTRLLDELSRGEGYVCSQITDMYPGYLSGGAATMTLTPAWFIETDTWRFIVDGVTGTVTATE